MIWIKSYAHFSESLKDNKFGEFIVAKLKNATALHSNAKSAQLILITLDY